MWKNLLKKQNKDKKFKFLNYAFKMLSYLILFLSDHKHCFLPYHCLLPGN